MYFKHQKYPFFSLSELNYFSQFASGYPVCYKIFLSYHHRSKVGLLVKPNTKRAVIRNALKNLKHIAGFEPGPPIEIQISRSCKISIFENSRDGKTREVSSQGNSRELLNYLNSQSFTTLVLIQWWYVPCFRS